MGFGDSAQFDYWEGMVLMAILGLVGLFWAFFGSRNFILVRFTAGICYAFFITFNLLEDHSDFPGWLNLVLGGGAGLFGGTCLLVSNIMGVVCFQFFAGAFLGLLILATPLTYAIKNNAWVCLPIVLVLGALSGLFTLYKPQHAIMWSTAFSGSYIVGLAMDFFVFDPHTPIIRVLAQFVKNPLQSVKYDVNDWHVWPLFVAILAASVLGLLIQIVVSRMTPKDDPGGEPLGKIRDMELDI